MAGKHGLGAMGEFVRERFRDRCPKIIARLNRVEALRRRIVEDAPGQIQRPATFYVARHVAQLYVDNNWWPVQNP
jgi:hypothetical protein